MARWEPSLLTKTRADLTGALVGLDKRMSATSTGVTKSGVMGAGPCVYATQSTSVGSKYEITAGTF